MSIRVIRILEHIYPDHQSFESDVVNWYLQPNSVRTGLANGLTIRSGMLIPETVEDPVIIESHTPTIAPKETGIYGVVCQECSDAALEYVKCDRLMMWPNELRGQVSE